MRAVLSAGIGFFAAAIVAWAVSVFALRLPWETTLLVIEVSAAAGALFAGILGLRTGHHTDL